MSLVRRPHPCSTPVERQGAMSSALLGIGRKLSPAISVYELPEALHLPEAFELLLAEARLQLAARLPRQVGQTTTLLQIELGERASGCR